MNKKIRYSNFELFRIILMLSIICQHLTTQSNILKMKPEFNVFFAEFMGGGGRIAASCFVLISAYFMTDKSLKIRRIITLWEKVIIYSISITLVCKYIFKVDVSLNQFIQAFIPVQGRAYWFVTAYIGLMFLSPVLNYVINQLPQILYKYLIVISIYILVVIPTFLLKKPFYSELSWCIFLYLFIGYMKKYGIRWMDKITDKKIYCILIFSFSYIGMFLLNVIITKVGYSYDTGIQNYSNYILYYNNNMETIPSFICTISIFLFIKKLKVKKNDVINVISKSTLYVYIIHQTPALQNFLWNSIFKVNTWLELKWYPILYVLVIFIIYIVSSGIDLIFNFATSNFINRINNKLFGCKYLNQFNIYEIFEKDLLQSRDER